MAVERMKFQPDPDLQERSAEAKRQQSILDAARQLREVVQEIRDWSRECIGADDAQAELELRLLGSLQFGGLRGKMNEAIAAFDRAISGEGDGYG